eukprot:TRINITY_DN6642_c1_g1_i1.p1 TRINITY_DN6642_c1_g1~~TRINITY_DN6642_c1_g1_i1.p1  ORF type:complete len:182 (+),score=24.76 TRINITY_DN6642_c1_g1_i1:152-697(+)
MERGMVRHNPHLTQHATAPCFSGLDYKITMRRSMRRQAYEQAVSREATRIVEDVIVPELSRATEDSNHENDLNIIVPHIYIGPLPRDLPPSYKRKAYEEAVQRVVQTTLQEKGLTSYDVTLESTFTDNLLPQCGFAYYWCLAMPSSKKPVERCMTFTCTVPSLPHSKDVVDPLISHCSTSS